MDSEASADWKREDNTKSKEERGEINTGWCTMKKNYGNDMSEMERSLERGVDRGVRDENESMIRGMIDVVEEVTEAEIEAVVEIGMRTGIETGEMTVTDGDEHTSCFHARSGVWRSLGSLGK